MGALQLELGKRRPFASAEQEAYLNLIRTAAALEGPILTLLKQHALSESTYNVLRILRGSSPGGRTCSQIRRDMVVRVPDVTRLVDRLVKRKLAKRTRSDDDRRVVLVHVTKKGLDLLERLDGPVLEAHEAQLGHLSADELKELNRLLAKARAGVPKEVTS